MKLTRFLVIGLLTFGTLIGCGADNPINSRSELEPPPLAERGNISDNQTFNDLDRLNQVRQFQHVEPRRDNPKWISHGTGSLALQINDESWFILHSNTPFQYKKTEEEIEIKTDNGGAVFKNLLESQRWDIKFSPNGLIITEESY